MRAAIYARLSTQDGRQDPENQLAQLRQFPATQGWEIAGEYIDHSRGGRADRAEFRKLLNDAAQRRLDEVLFWALDRFTREGALETLKYLDRLTGYQIGYRSFTEPYLDSCGMFKDAIIAIPMGRFSCNDQRSGASTRTQRKISRCKRVGGTQPSGAEAMLMDCAHRDQP